MKGTFYGTISAIYRERSTTPDKIPVREIIEACAVVEKYSKNIFFVYSVENFYEKERRK